MITGEKPIGERDGNAALALRGLENAAFFLYK
jgi:hypothetical protein